MRKLKQILNLRAARQVATQLTAQDSIAKVLSNSRHPIPVIVISYNNGVYVDNMVRQLNQFEIVPIVIDNRSNDENTLRVLADIHGERAEIIRGPRNLGHTVGFMEPIYQLLPEVFAYTDPDLQFNPNLPQNFLLELQALTDRYESYKAGMALDVTSFGPLKPWQSSTKRKYPFRFHKQHDLLDWEHQFWTMPLKHETLEVYAAAVDTTFAVYQKKFFNGELTRGVRVAGAFSACHLPWHQHLDIRSQQEQERYLKEKNVGFG